LEVADWLIAAIALAILTVINCFGVRAGSSVQNLFMVLKIAALLTLIICGLWVIAPTETAGTGGIGTVAGGFGLSTLTVIGAAMVPVLFAYGGWQTSTFVASEIREPRKNLPRALLIGVAGVVFLYLAANFVYVGALGVSGLANTTTPASDVMRLALGQTGARLIAAGITISTLGFLSQGMLTAPRVYFAMAEDGLFFRSVAKLHPRTHVPVVSITLQGAMAIAIAYWGKYEQILNYVVSVDFIFFGATAACLFILRRRGNGTEKERRFTRVPGHPVTTLAFVIVCWLVVINTVYRYPRNTAIGLAIVLAGIPVYFFWRARNKQ
jgi:APA family basic amino acid/polyamine antiporter